MTPTKRNLTEQQQLDDEHTPDPSTAERRRDVERAADRGSQGMTGGAERSAGHELER